MTRLRHPINAIREPFGTAGLIVAMVALVAALGGTAFAASKLNSTQKKEVEKIAKKYAGKPGANGAAGPAGPAGPAGAAGSNGSSGTNGKSVTVSEIPAEEPGCEERGGAMVKQEGAGSGVEVCTGEKGPRGAQGEPWPAGGTLPHNATETGTWAVGIRTTSSGSLYSPISFNIPLAHPLKNAEECGEPGKEACHVNFIREGETAPAGCAGGTAESPKAQSGNLCVYVGEAGESRLLAAILQNPGSGEEGETGTTGVLLHAILSETEFSYAYGTWAVTG